MRLSKDKKTLTVAFEGGDSFALPAEYLRVKSPSAEVQGHSPDERKTVPGKRNVMILEVQPVGNYAARLVFDDLHSTGIFSWDYLLELGRNQPRYWQDYVDELAAKGMTRDADRSPHGADRATLGRLQRAISVDHANSSFHPRFGTSPPLRIRPHRITTTFAPTLTRP